MKKPEGLSSSTGDIYYVVAMDVYKSGARLHRRSNLQGEHVRTGTRGSIKVLSKRSLDRMAFTAINTSVRFASLLTLTYPSSFPLTGTRAKADLQKLLNYLSRTYVRLEYLWVLEFQPKRGAPHFHVCLNIPEPNKWMRRDMAVTWAKIVSRETVEREKVVRVHSHPRAWERVRKQGGLGHYIVKYATKPEQKVVPREFQDVGRFWGCSTGVRPKPIQQNVKVDDDEVREFLKRRDDKFSEWDFIPRLVWW